MRHFMLYKTKCAVKLLKWTLAPDKSVMLCAYLLHKLLISIL